MSQAELARQLTEALGRSIDRAAINKMTTGNRKISGDEMLAITRILKPASSEPASQASIREGLATSIPMQVRPASSELAPYRIAGKVEAGAFRPQEDLGDWDEAKVIYDKRDPKYPDARHLSFDVDGDSMNALKPRPILSGDQVLAVSYEDISDRTPIRDGMVVVVERSRYSGMEREWSIKQIELYADRIEFHPRSTNPRHEVIKVPRDNTADDGQKVEIIALVRRVSNELPG
ncbi:hypothetical protein FG93_01964 [Bosea sp. LC85]|uniref:S24 family peptidase n=1 Tax=Bosea sp. LC85 TaxID=1502851 RepID=UPI0004E2AD4E|nr:S24 family peptidase [Bosea sp. LC85]KFC73220.1 hypothetical protein FG93_01964 [Bosea sp. LC85]